MTVNCISVYLTSELRLEQALKEAGVEKPASVRKLAISGEITEADFGYIRENMAKTLQELDMGGATSTEIIGRNFFSGCESLTSVIIPASTLIIGKTAFEDCRALTEISVHPDNPEFASANGILYNKDFSELLFFPCAHESEVVVSELRKYYDSLKFEFVLPASVTKIGATAFANCKKLLSVDIPETVTGIGGGAFEGCTALTSVYIPASVVEIYINDYEDTYRRAFYGCSALKSITVHPDNPVYASCDGVLFNKDITELIIYPAGLQGEYKIPETVNKIGFYAFAKCSGLTDVYIPDLATDIDNGAFAGCTGLTSVIIPDSVKRIGGCAFYDCKNLRSINIPDSVTEIGASVFSSTDLKSLFIPASVVYIGLWAFCDFPVKVHPGNPAYSSKNSVLFNKKKTTLIEFPCWKTGDYIIPKTVKRIEQYAFYDCSGLTSITIPASVVKFGSLSSTFYECSNLASITVHPQNRFYSSHEGVLFNKNMTVLLKFPPKWQGDEYIVPDSVEKIDTSAFKDCVGLTSVIIPDSVVEIEFAAFAGCSGLKKVVIPKATVNIGIGAFDKHVYVKVHPKNPVYKSIKGKIVRKNPNEKWDIFYI